MVHFDKEDAKGKVLEYLRYPVPRTPISIARYLKEEIDNFYPNTEDYRAVKKLKKHVLKDLEQKNLIVKYEENDSNWENARELLKRHYDSTGRSKPRKLSELYQINFFYLGNDARIYQLPVIKEINLDIVALMYRFVEERDEENFFWNILNLFYCYSKDEYKGKIRVKVHGPLFEEKESRILERLLDYTENMEGILDKIPFKPDIDRALEFLESI